MCLTRRQVDYLERTNEDDFQRKRVSYETYIRFGDIVERCRACELCDNGQFGDILGECRLRFVRVFISLKRDAERDIADKIERLKLQRVRREGGQEGEAGGAPA